MSGRGHPGVWTRVPEKATINSNSEKKALIPVLGPISGSDLEFLSSRIYEGLDRKPTLQPTWDTVLPLQNQELRNYRINHDSAAFAQDSLESASLSSRLPIQELPKPPKAPEPVGPGALDAVLVEGIGG